MTSHSSLGQTIRSLNVVFLQVPLQASGFCSVHREGDVPPRPLLQANGPQPVRDATQVCERQALAYLVIKYC